MSEVGQGLEEVWKGGLQLGNEGKLEFKVGDAGCNLLMERVKLGGPQGYMQRTSTRLGLGGKVQPEELGHLWALGLRGEGVFQKVKLIIIKKGRMTRVANNARETKGTHHFHALQEGGHDGH